MAKTLKIDPEDATAKQLLLAVYQSNLRMETLMADLSQAVADLQGAVDGVAERLLPQVTALQAALAEATAAGAAGLEAAQTAADAIEGQVDELNALGADPSTPVATA